jgi:hypothetical protein
MTTEAVGIPVIFTPELLATLFSRDHLGNRLAVATHGPLSDGFYDVIVTVDYTDNLVRAALTALRAEVEGLREPTLGLKGGVNRSAVLAAIDRALGDGTSTDAHPRG